MIIYTVGTFDLLHVGHLALLEYCRTLGDVVAVGDKVKTRIMSIDKADKKIALSKKNAENADVEASSW